MLRWISLLVLLPLSAWAQQPGGVVFEQRPYVEAATAAPAAESIAASSFDIGSFTAADGMQIPYRLKSPALRPGTKFPLVLVLHGSGAIGTDNAAQLGPFAKAWALPAIVARFPAYVLVPQVPVRSADYAPGADGMLASRPGAPLPALAALIDRFSRTLPIDPSRIYLVGFSMGASASLQMLLHDPNHYAAIVAFSAVPPERTEALRVARVPMLLVHGSDDTENPFDADRAWADALSAAGGTQRFRVYQGMDHRIPPDMLEADDWRAWLFAQRR